MLRSFFRELLRKRESAAPASASGEPASDALAARRRAFAFLSDARHAEGEAEFRRMLGHNPDDAELRLMLACCLTPQGRWDEAVAELKAAVRLRPDYVPAYFNLSGALQSRGDLREAKDALERVLELQPVFPEALCSLAGVLRQMGAAGEAEARLREAIEQRPTLAAAHYNLGNLLHSTGRVAEAIASYRTAVVNDPQFVTAHDNLLFCLNSDPRYSPADILKEHAAWAARHAAPLTPAAPSFHNEPDSARRLRIGYVSPDFKSHSVAYFLEPVLEQHDRALYEVWCYVLNGESDEVTARLRGLADHWVECGGLPDEALAQRIRQDGIDILIDLAGHTKANRLLVFARWPAPVQVTWLGYPTTAGVPAIQFRLTDGQVDPPGMQAFNTEQPVRLPHSYFCYRPLAGAPAVGELPALKAGYITFGSFNSCTKLSDQGLELWARVLAKLPDTRLLLKAAGLGDAATRAQLQGRFAQLGVAADRLVLLGAERKVEDHLAHYNRVDIGLDTYPYNGATTTCEALWMGVPVVTLKGETHASRMGASLLTAAGLQSLVATTPEQYAAVCVNLATDTGRLAALRTGMRARLGASPLMDAAGFTRAIEEQYRALWRDWCQQRGMERQ